MAPAEAELRRSRAASPAPPRKAAATASGADENERRGAAAGNARPELAEDAQKAAPMKQQAASKADESTEEVPATGDKPAWGDRRRVLLAVAALFGMMLMVALVWISGVGHALTLSPALAGALAAAALGAISIVGVFVVVRRRCRSGACSDLAASEAKEKDA